MCFDCSLVVQRPWVLILLQTAPQPFLEASQVVKGARMVPMEAPDWSRANG